MPDGFVTRLSRAQARAGADRIGLLSAQVDRRRTIAGRYSDWLSANGRTPASEPPELVHAFLRYPIRVTDRPGFIASAERAGVDLGDWFVSPIHPVVDGLDRWGYRVGSAPNADLICQEIVNLPTVPSFRDRDVERVIAFLGDHLSSIR